MKFPKLFTRPELLAFETDSISSKEKDNEPESAELCEQIGRLKVELEWLKKKLPRTREEALKWIDRSHEALNIRRQCELLTFIIRSCTTSRFRNLKRTTAINASDGR